MSELQEARHAGRPHQYGPRVTKAVRLDADLDDRLKKEAAARSVSANLIINKAVEDYLERLVPLDEVLRTAS